MLSDFHFVRPMYLLLLIPLALLVWQLVRSAKQSNTWRQVCDAHLLPHIMLASQQTQQFVGVVLIGVVGLFSVFALAGPTWVRMHQNIFRAQHARVIVIDLSPAMLAADLKPNRITRAKYKIQDLLEHNKEGQIGMVAFSDDAYIVSPLTDDAATISAMVPELSPNIMPAPGNNIASGLEKAAALITQGGHVQGEIILMTASPVNSSSLAAAKKLQSKGITTSILGMGTQQGAPIPTFEGYLKNSQGEIVISQLNIPGLKQMAGNGGGRFVKFSNQDKDLEILLSKAENLSLKAGKNKNMTNLWRDEGRWLLLFMLPIAACAFRKGWFENIIL